MASENRYPWRVPEYAQFFADVEERVGRPPRERQHGDRPAPFVRQGTRIVERWRSAESAVSANRPVVPVRVRVPDGTKRDPLPGQGSATDEVELDSDWNGEFGGFGTETLACYLPWHIFRPVWGIVLNQSSLDQYAQRFADQCGCSLNEIRPLVVQQVIQHEYVHFDFEVIATQVEDALGEHRYVEYVWNRYWNANNWTNGPLEELIATAAESAFARLPAQRLPYGIKPRGYTRAVTKINRTAPPGYRDFERMDDPVDAERIAADLVGVIANDRGVVGSGWYPRTSRADRSQVPIYWDGEPTGCGEYGLARNVPQIPTLKRFESWAEKIEGAVLKQGAKHRKVEFPNGQTITYSAPKKTGRLFDNQVSKIAQAAGLHKASDLNLCVADDISTRTFLAAGGMFSG